MARINVGAGERVASVVSGGLLAWYGWQRDRWVAMLPLTIAARRWYDKVKQRMSLVESDRSTALQEVITSCSKGGAVSIAGVYGGYDDKIPLGATSIRPLRSAWDKRTCSAT